MRIRDLVCSTGRSGYFNKDLRAIQAGAVPEGFRYLGAPLTPGFRQVCQAGEAISVMLILEDGSVALGDCVDVIFAGAAGRDPVFRAEDHLLTLKGPVREIFKDQDILSFTALAREMDEFKQGGKKLHTALRYGVTQALLHAAALARRKTMAEVIAEEYGCEISPLPVPIACMCPTDQRFQVDKMIMKRVAMLPHGSFSHAGRDLGPGGGKLMEYLGWVAGRVRELGEPGYSPAIHVDLYGTLGELCGMRAAAVAGFLEQMQETVAPLELFVETPVIASDQQRQVELCQAIRQALRERGCGVRLIADEWCNTLEDIRLFADAGAADIIQVKTPDLGSIHNSIEALLYCRGKGQRTYVGGTANGTDQSSRVSVHIALATQADFLMCKPGQGVDEGLMIETNEMQRTLALISS